MPLVLGQQIQALNESALAIDQERSMVCYEIEDLMDVSVGLLASVKAMVRRWQERVADWADPVTVQQAKKYEGLYRTLQGTVARIDSQAARVERLGYTLGGRDAFALAKREIDVLCALSVDRLVRADRDFAEGRGRSMGEVRDALRRRLGT